MKILASLVIAYTAVMLLIHLTSWELLRRWDAPGNSWIKRWFSAQTALRVEAVYWLLLLASWPFWPSAAWEVVVVAFAVIHIGAWLVGERRAIRRGAAPASLAKAHRYIVGFDLVEAGALIAIVWSTVLYVGRSY